MGICTLENVSGTTGTIGTGTICSFSKWLKINGLGVFGLW